MHALNKELVDAGGDFAILHTAFNQSLADLENSLAFVQKNHNKDYAFAGSVSVDLLMLTGTVTGTWLMAKSALAARRRLESIQGNRGFNETKITTARFFCEHISPLTYAYAQKIQAGHETVKTLAEDQF